MATIADDPDISVDSLRFFTNSNAVALSNPRVLLSQHCRGLWPRALLQNPLEWKGSKMSSPEFSLRFCNADTFSLSSRYASDEIISNFGVKGVSQAEDSHDHIPHMFGILLPGNPWYSVSGSYLLVIDCRLPEES